MVKRTNKFRRRTRIVKSGVPTDNQLAMGGPSTSDSNNESSSSNFFVSISQPREARVPPLPEQPRQPDYSANETLPNLTLSNRRLKLLKNIEKKQSKEKPGYIKVRVPIGTPRTTSRVPPTENVQAITSGVPAESTASLPPVESAQAVTSRYSVTPSSSALGIGTSGKRHTLSNAGRIDSTRGALGWTIASPDLDVSIDSLLPSFVFTPTSERGESECAASPKTVESHQHVSEMGSYSGESNEDIGKVTIPQMQLKTGQIDSKIRVASADYDDAEMDKLAQLVRSTKIDIEENVSGGLDQPLSQNSENPASNLGGPVVHEYAESHSKEDGKKLVSMVTADDCLSALNILDKYIANAQNMKTSIVTGMFTSNSDNVFDIPYNSMLGVNIVKIIDIVQNSAGKIRRALEAHTSAVGDAGAVGVSMNKDLEIAECESYSAKTSDNDELADKPQEVPTHLGTAPCSQVESGDSPIADSPLLVQGVSYEQQEAPSETADCSQLESDHSLIKNTSSPVTRGQEEADEQQKSVTHPQTARSQMESDTSPIEDCPLSIPGGQGAVDDQQGASTPTKTARSQAKSGDAQSLHPEGSLEGVVGVKEADANDYIPVTEDTEIVLSLQNEGEPRSHYVDVNFARSTAKGCNRPTVYSDQENLSGVVLEGELPDKLYQFPLQVAIDINQIADEDASDGIDLNLNPARYHCPSRNFCLEARRLRSHLDQCWRHVCSEKHCSQITQVIGLWIHCVAKNCEVCPPLEENNEEVLEKVTRPSKVIRETDLKDSLTEQPALSPTLNEFFTSEGQYVLLGYFVEYFLDAFLAYNILLQESGKRVAADISEQELPEKEFIETVRHSCNCPPLNNCRVNQCHRLRVVIAHWSKWNGLCSFIECRLCDRIGKRLRKDRNEISHVTEFLSSNKAPARATKLTVQLIRMVYDSDTDESIKSKLNWKDSSRMEFKNACVNSCLFNDVRYGEMDADKDEHFDLVSIFDKRRTLQLLVLSRNLIYRAISLKERKLFVESSTLAAYFTGSLKCGVKIISAVHQLVKKELSLSDDTWESGSDISGCNIGQDRKYFMQIGSKMGNKMRDFAESQ